MQKSFLGSDQESLLLYLVLVYKACLQGLKVVDKFGLLQKMEAFTQKGVEEIPVTGYKIDNLFSVS